MFFNKKSIYLFTNLPILFSLVIFKESKVTITAFLSSSVSPSFIFETKISQLHKIARLKWLLFNNINKIYL